MKIRINPWPYILITLLAGIIAYVAWLAAISNEEHRQVKSGSWYINGSRFALSAHKTLQCLDCHTDFKKAGLAHPDPRNLDRDPTLLVDQSRCARCHKDAYIIFLSGHERFQARSAKDLPGCGDCHDVHYQRANLSRTELGATLARKCGRCHPKELSGYLRDYHGKTAVLLGYGASAFCQDCHGGHDLMRSADKSEMLRRCRVCHPRFTARSLDYVVHLKTDRQGEDVKAIRIAEKLMLWFVIIVLILFYVHMSLWGLRLWHDRSRGSR